MRRRTIVVNGIATAVVAAGDASSTRATVFVHGNPGGLAEFLRLVEKTSAHGRAIAMDMPGFGHTDAPEDFAPSVDAYAAHLTALLEELRVDQADLVLHDFGGPWGLQHAADHPQRVSSLLLMNALGMPGYRWHRLAKLWRTPVLGELFVAATSRPATALLLREGNPIPIPDEHIDRMAAQASGAGGDVVLALYRDTPPDWGDRIAPRLAGLDVPVRVVWGDRDPYLPIAAAQRFREPFPQASFVRLRDVGHWPMLTHPDLTADVVDHWIASRQR